MFKLIELFKGSEQVTQHTGSYNECCEILDNLLTRNALDFVSDSYYYTITPTDSHKYYKEHEDD